MLKIVKSIYKMTGTMVTLPEDEDTPEKVRLDRALEAPRRPAANESAATVLLPIARLEDL